MRRLKNINKSVVKLSLFLTLIGLPVMVLSWFYKPSQKKTAIHAFFDEVATQRDTAIYFIGSSRVQMGINPAIIQRQIKVKAIYNAGITGGTFLTNCIIANRIMESPAPKVLFVELALMLPGVPDYILKHRDDLGLKIFGTANSLLQNRSVMERWAMKTKLANQYFTSKIFVVDEVRNIFGVNVEVAERKFGFNPTYENRVHTTTSFLKISDFKTFKNAQSVSEYRQYIDALLINARKSHTRIVFFLPITYRTDAEKVITIPLYQSLPYSQKIPLSEVFLTSITNPAYLFDVNHLNYKGAKIYSEWMAKQIIPFMKN